jgi:hypothetical protein
MELLGLLEKLEQVVGVGLIAPLLAQPRHDLALLREVPFAQRDMPVRLLEMIPDHRQVHGFSLPMRPWPRAHGGAGVDIP